MQDFIRQAKGFIADHANLLCGIIITVFGAAVRLAYDHKDFEPFNRQTAYDICRSLSMSGTVVFIAFTASDVVCSGGVSPVAITVGAAIYAEEIIAAGQGVVKTIVDTIVKKVVK